MVRSSSKPSVLVIDDDQDIREYFADVLGFEGFEVTTLADPRAAVDCLRGGVFDLVLLDEMMPKLSGLELLPQLRLVDDDIAVVIMTAAPSLETAVASIPHGVSAYIWHPITPAEFRTVIAQIAKKKGLGLKPVDEVHAGIGRRLRALRKARGLTLEQMARRTNLSVSRLSQIERAESSASVSSLVKVAAALEVPLTALFGGR